MRKYYQAGYIRKDAAAVTDFLADEKAGVIFAATKSLKPGKDGEMTNSTGRPWVQADITPPVMSNRETTDPCRLCPGLPSTRNWPCVFLELFNTDKYLNNLINYGIEGTHYVKVGENTIKAGPDVAKYNPQTGWMFGNHSSTIYTRTRIQKSGTSSSTTIPKLFP
jgi:putative aldouronate transport system substrate-binding protein